MGNQWDGVLPTLLRRCCATLVGESITYQPEDLAASSMANDFPAHRGNRAPKLLGDSPKGQTSGDTTRDRLPLSEGQVPSGS